VHRATLKDGKEVAIKVQRDSLKEMYDLDLAQFDQAGSRRACRFRERATPAPTE